MDRITFNKLYDEVVADVKATLTKKGADYANEDALSNFKEVGEATGTSPQITCLTLIATKVARLGVLFNSGKEPQNEAVVDSIRDLVGYSTILYVLEQDKEEREETAKALKTMDPIFKPRG